MGQLVLKPQMKPAIKMPYTPRQPVRKAKTWVSINTERTPHYHPLAESTEQREPPNPHRMQTLISVKPAPTTVQLSQ